MRPWLLWGLTACVLSGCPLEPLMVTGFGAAAIRAGSTNLSPTVTLSVPGVKASDASGLTALLNGVPVPIVSTKDGELAIKIPPGLSASDTAQFELYRDGALVASRDIAAQLATGTGVSPTDAVTVKTNGETTAVTPTGSSGGGITINITVPPGVAGSGGTTVVTTDGTGSSGSGSGSSSNTGTASPTPTPTATPSPTPTATPTPAPSFVPVADQTPIPGGIGEVTGDVQF